MRLTGLLVIQLDLFSTESYSETWNTLWYFSLIRSYMECKRLCNKVLERIENIFFLEIVLRISFRSGSNNNYTIKKFVILEETSGDQPLLKAWSGRAGWSGPCLITFWIWKFHSLFRPVFNCPLFFSSKILCLHAFPIWRCSRFGRTCAVPYSAWTHAGEKVPQGLSTARHRLSLLLVPCAGCLQAGGWEMGNLDRDHNVVSDQVWTAPPQGLPHWRLYICLIFFKADYFV